MARPFRPEPAPVPVGVDTSPSRSAVEPEFVRSPSPDPFARATGQGLIPDKREEAHDQIARYLERQRRVR